MAKKKKTKDFERMTAAAVAELYGVQPVAVGRWAAAGCPRNSDRSWNLAEVIKWREAKLRGELNDLEQRKEKAIIRYREAKAEKEEIALKAQKGLYVPRAHIEDVVVMACSALSNRMDRLLVELPARLAGRERGEVERTLDAALGDVLEAFAGELAEIGGEGDDNEAEESGRESGAPGKAGAGGGHNHSGV